MIFFENLYISIWGKEEFIFILWILSNAFELDANIANFVYYGKTEFCKSKDA